MSQSVTSTGLYVAYLLQIETNRPAKSKTTTKVPVNCAPKLGLNK